MRFWYVVGRLAFPYGANAFDHEYAFQVVYDKSSVLSIAFWQVSSDLKELDEMLYNLNVLSGGGGMGGR